MLWHDGGFGVLSVVEGVVLVLGTNTNIRILQLSLYSLKLSMMYLLRWALVYG